MVCSVAAAILLSISSALAEWRIALISMSFLSQAAFSLMLIRMAGDADTSREIESAYIGNSKGWVRSVGFVPHGEQAICLFAGFSMLGWGFFQVNEDTVLGLDLGLSVSPAIVVCSVFLIASIVLCLGFCFRGARRAAAVGGLLGAWVISGAVLFGLGLLGCAGPASPVGAMLMGFPGIVLVGMLVDGLVFFQIQHGFESLAFAFPVTALIMFSVWCGGCIVADTVRSLTSEAVSAVCAVGGGAIGLMGVRSAWGTIQRRAALDATDFEMASAALRGAGLTQTEVRVALLLCGGLTAREAAEKLFIERTTVLSHVRSTYMKLAVHSRGELEAAVVELVRERVH